MKTKTAQELAKWKETKHECPICGLKHPKRKRPLQVTSCGMCRFDMVGDTFYLWCMDDGKWKPATDAQALEYINKGIAFNSEATYRVEKDVGFEDDSDVVKYEHVADFPDFGSVQAFLESKKVAEQQQLYVTLWFGDDDWDDETFNVRGNELIDITYWYE